MSGFKPVQELFMVLFSILYGVQLQSLSGLMPFPLGRIICGYQEREGHINKYEQCAQRRMRQTYKARNIQDKNFEKWSQHVWVWRFLISAFVLNILPILYFIFILNILKEVDYTINPFWNIWGTFWLSLNVFAIYRFYHVLIIWNRTRHFFCDLDLDKRRISYNVGSNLIMSSFYHVLPAIGYIYYVLNTYY